MFGKQNALMNGDQPKQVTSEIEKETEYEEDRQQDDDNSQIKLIDKELDAQYKKQGLMFPSINSKQNSTQQNTPAQSKKKGDKLPELGKSEKSINKQSNQASKIQTQTYVFPRQNLQKQKGQVRKEKIQKEQEVISSKVEEQPSKNVEVKEINQQQNSNTQNSIQPQESVALQAEESIAVVEAKAHQQPQQQQALVQIQSSCVNKITQTALQTVTCFTADCKSSTILFEDQENSSAFQSANYYQNHKLVLTQPITSLNSTCKFKIENIKYCVGFGVGLKEVIQKHGYDYQSEGSNQLSHGLYIVTSQGYSWSHSQKEQDDIHRNGFNQLYNGFVIEVSICGEEITFKWKKGEFKLTLPTRVRQKYCLCYCAYLHEKSDAISISR